MKKEYFYFYCVAIFEDEKQLILDGTITTNSPIKSSEDFKELSIRLKNNYKTKNLVIMNLNLLFED